MYKSSHYNFLIPLPEKNVKLLYNSFTGGLFELTTGEGELMEKLMSQKSFLLETLNEDLINSLIDANFIVKEDLDEKELYFKEYSKYRDSLLNENGRLALTITPTLDCNFACRYCFQDPSAGRVMTKETINDILNFITKEIEEKKIIKNYKSIGITWFGGEPLLAPGIIKEFTERILKIAEKFDIKYESSIVSNGSLMTPQVIELLRECKIRNIQITLDGSSETHDIRRPFKDDQNSTYDQILKNIPLIPEDIGVTIRVNCDKIVWENIDTLFDDLEKFEIWPQRPRQCNIELAYITVHDNSRFTDSNWYFDYEEFITIKEEFANFKLDRYNKWAPKNNKKLAKKRFKMPNIMFHDCMSAVYPGGFVFDTEGYIHKCWEEVDKPEKRVMHVTDKYDIDNPKLSKWLNVTRFYRTECSNCKYIPICDTQCTKKVIEDHKNFNCSSWKYSLEDLLKNQYIMTIDEPESIGPMGKKN